MFAESNFSMWWRSICSQRGVLAFAATACLLVGTTSHARIASSLVTKEYRESDSKYFFKGNMSSTGEPNTKPTNGTWPVEQLPANPDKSWEFSASFTGDGFESVRIGGEDHVVVRNAGVLLNPDDFGLHLPALHQGENPNNQLTRLSPEKLFSLSTEESPKDSKETLITNAVSTNFGRVPHGGEHYDYYGFTADISISAFGGTATLRANELRAYAKHDEDDYKEDFKKWVKNTKYKASTDPNFAPANTDATKPLPQSEFPPNTISFDVETRSVTIAPSAINVLNRGDTSWQGLEPQFATDPLLGAVMQVTPLQLLQSPDGFFSLSGGEMRLDNESTGVHFSVQFDELSLVSDPDSGGVNYVGAVSGGSIDYLPQEEFSFTAEMVDTLIVPEGIDSDYSLLGLFLEPVIPLLEATNNFTQSAVVPLATSLAGIDPGHALAGDFDFNGNVDKNDLLLWQANYGVSTDGDDLLTWQRELGSHRRDQSNIVTGVVQNVPEPASLMLGLAALVLGSFCRRQVS